MTEIHDSNTCTRGVERGKCEMCQFAGELQKSSSESPSELSAATKEAAGFLGQEPKNVLQGTIGSAMAPVATTAIIRAALMDVIDYGTADVKCWMLYEWEGNNYGEDDTNRQRQLFADAVIQRIAELQKLNLSTNTTRDYDDG